MQRRRGKVGVIILVILLLVIGVIALLVVGGIVKVGKFAMDQAAFVVEDTVAVAKQELSPSALNEKYEWFKNTYAQLDARRATVNAKAQQIGQMYTDYGWEVLYDRDDGGYILSTTMNRKWTDGDEEMVGEPFKDWNRSDRQAISTYRQELMGLKASANTMCAQYNAEMSKFHTAFTNAGNLPVGGTGIPGAFSRT